MPQIKQQIAYWRPVPQTTDESGEEQVVEVTPPTEGNGMLFPLWILRIDQILLLSGLVVWSVLETFVYMDLARTTELNIDMALSAFDTILWDNPSEQPGDVAYRKLLSSYINRLLVFIYSEFYTRLAWTIEETLQEQSTSEIPDNRYTKLL